MVPDEMRAKMLYVTISENDQHDYISFLNFPLFAKYHIVEGLWTYMTSAKILGRGCIGVVYCKKTFKDLDLQEILLHERCAEGGEDMS